MPYIYKITNSLNGKIYIGKTMKTVEERWREHCHDYTRRDEESRPLYSAMRKYGINNFTVEEIEKCSDQIVNERERYWIEYYGSFKNGYNATIGGDGRAYIDYDLVVSVYNELQNRAEVARRLNICEDSVTAILKAKEIPFLTSQEVSRRLHAKIIKMYDKNGNYIMTFTNYSEAGSWLIENGYSNCKHSTIRYHVSEVCHGKRKSAAGFIFKEEAE